MKKRFSWRRTVLLGLIGAGTWAIYRSPEPALLSFRVGQTFEEVVEGSTYPVLERSILPAEHPRQFGATYVTSPAVIIHFNDPRYGFTLPPTKFAALTYVRNRAMTLSTSPMLEMLPFDDAVIVLEDLQRQFQAGGWRLFDADGSIWFDFTPEGKRRLLTHLLEHDMKTVSLYVSKKYAMTFRLWCATGCITGKPPYRFMIDIGVGTDTHSWKRGDPEIWETAPPSPAVPAPRRKQSYAASPPPGP